MRNIIKYGFGVAVGIGVQAACVSHFLDPNHCEALLGDATCREKYDDGRVFCSESTCAPDAIDGCVTERPVEDVCHAACGGDKTLDQDPDCEGVAEGSSSSESASEATSEPTGEATSEPTGSMSMSASGTETGSSSTTTSGCTDSSECTDTAAPICVDSACVPCSTDDECGAKDPGLPACRDDGYCVACTPANPSACEGTTPLCNVELFECEGCRFHEQCDATACDIATGACFGEECVVEVDGDGGADYTDIQDAIGDGCVVVVHELDGGVPYNESLTISGDTVALVAASGETPIVVGVGGNPSLALTGAATAYVQGLTFTDSDAEGITASGASLWLDRTQVVGNTGGGIALTSGADGHLRNCFVGGDNEIDIAGIDIASSTADILYTTLVGYDDGFGGGSALRCTGPGGVNVRNSLVAKTGTGAELDCVNADLTYSATESVTPGVGNVMLGSVMPAWFVSVTTDYHLENPPAAILTAAQWQLGDPPVDIDGALRPTEDGTADVAGADVL